jgi:hypothetical protein
MVVVRSNVHLPNAVILNIFKLDSPVRQRASEGFPEQFPGFIEADEGSGPRTRQHECIQGVFTRQTPISCETATAPGLPRLERYRRYPFDPSALKIDRQPRSCFRRFPYQGWMQDHSRRPCIYGCAKPAPVDRLHQRCLGRLGWQTIKEHFG